MTGTDDPSGAGDPRSALVTLAPARGELVAAGCHVRDRCLVLQTKAGTGPAPTSGARMTTQVSVLGGGYDTDPERLAARHAILFEEAARA